MEHVNYPHTPGQLYDCPECESQCFCGDLRYETSCVYCALLEEIIREVQ